MSNEQWKILLRGLPGFRAVEVFFEKRKCPFGGWDGVVSVRAGAWSYFAFLLV
jgi:hypothetical protein